MRPQIEHTLCTTDQDDLTWYWRDADPIIGLKSNMQAQIDALNSSSVVAKGFEPSIALSGITYVPSPKHVARAPERSGRKVAAANRANRIGAILARLVKAGGSWEEMVLFRMYGAEECPMLHIAALGEFSRIVGLTPIAQGMSVHELREHVEKPMVKARALKQSSELLRDASLVYADTRERFDAEAAEDRARVKQSLASGYLGVVAREWEDRAKKKRLYFEAVMRGTA